MVCGVVVFIIFFALGLPFTMWGLLLLFRGEYWLVVGRSYWLLITYIHTLCTSMKLSKWYSCGALKRWLIWNFVCECFFVCKWTFQLLMCSIVLEITCVEFRMWNRNWRTYIIIVRIVWYDRSDKFCQRGLSLILPEMTRTTECVKN